MSGLRFILFFVFCAGVLGGCAETVQQTPDQACGPTPTVEATTADFLNNYKNAREEYFGLLAVTPIDFLECRSNHGDRMATYVLGLEYLDGTRVAKDEAKAANLLRAAGVTTVTRRLTPLNKDTAASTQALYTRSVPVGGSYGLPEAQFALAKLYLEGKGVAKSESRAKKWLKRAAEQGHAAAQGLLDTLTERTASASDPS